MNTVEESNAAVRAAVNQRREAQAAGKPHEEWYTPPAEQAPDLQHQAETLREAFQTLDMGGPAETYSEWKPPAYADKHRPGTGAFLAVLDEIRQLHLRKTMDYGVDEDALANIRNSADVINVPAYAGCVLRMADKMQRLRSFFRRGEVEFDGVEDTLLDIAAYAAIALVVYREHVRGS